MRVSFLCGALVLAAFGCSGDRDCRNKGHECGEAFECRKNDAAKWECLPVDRAVETEDAGPPEPPGEAPAAGGEKEDGERRVTCPYHVLCPADAIRCECSGRGQLVSIETDSNRDGAPDRSVKLSRDERGLVTSIEIDEGADGEVDVVHGYHYQSRGNPSQHEVLKPTEGDAAGVRITYRYDVDGQLIGVDFDEKLDGEVDVRCTHDPPCPPPIPNASCDLECDGQIPGSQAFTLACMRHVKCTGQSVSCRCDTDGRLLRRVLDIDGDGRGDEVARFAYDRGGRMLAAIVDEGMDGTEEARHLYSYNEQGHPTRWDVLRKSAAGSKQVRYVYNEQSLLVAEQTDVGRDGKVDRECTYDPPCPPPIPNPACKPVCK
jgi:YD repeat-containing protein